MHESLIEHIKNHSTTPLTAADIEGIKKCFTLKKLRKRQFLLQEGEVCKYIAFIVKGAMRKYSVDEKGAEHIVSLSVENWWVGDRESFTKLTPTQFNIDAWEDTDILIATKEDFLSFVNPIPAIAEMLRELDYRHALALQKRIGSNISQSAEKRYYDLVDTYPEFVNRFPQHLIASYLGVTKETLSRVRHNAVKK
ncbi:MAG TPA: Crp/Fnr family transcriptional regulator [Bacteroidia bacterium]|nr:Crp/Fnr family transcriptional regulator [Bacteroidia bacterium]